ncbi:ArsR/SmtB family transcription factor [Alkaliphilus transvaalensis]|uniref:ArsR/SmtB family transcription factor n=1 Tax=Alkaliphilus transvaalensis TaxID=114628 RepID=UPI00047E2A62|nr:metalloregulator ArsR/SmtB family transcription factor [Alkaliphilus transvaalensis]
MADNIFFTLCADLIKAISHPTRIEILFILKDHEELCVCEIYENLELEQSNVSQHLKVLRDKGILTTRKDGLKVMYRVKHPEVYGVIEIVKSILQKQIAESQIHLSGGDR